MYVVKLVYVVMHEASKPSIGATHHACSHSHCYEARGGDDMASLCTRGGGVAAPGQVLLNKIFSSTEALAACADVKQSTDLGACPALALSLVRLVHLSHAPFGLWLARAAIPPASTGCC